MRKNLMLVCVVVTLAGCFVPQRSPEKLGTILATLPDIPETKEPYAFPYGDHANCKFSDDSFEQ